MSTVIVQTNELVNKLPLEFSVGIDLYFLSLSLSHTHTFSHTFSHTQSLSHTHTLTHLRRESEIFELSVDFVTGWQNDEFLQLGGGGGLFCKRDLS